VPDDPDDDHLAVRAEDLVTDNQPTTDELPRAVPGAVSRSAGFVYTNGRTYLPIGQQPTGGQTLFGYKERVALTVREEGLFEATVPSSRPDVSFRFRAGYRW